MVAMSAFAMPMRTTCTSAIALEAGIGVSNLFLLIGCLLAGVLLQRAARMPANAHMAINAVILHVSLPAVTLRALHDFSFDRAQLWPVLMPWALFAI
ncbi:MAG: hypothetical protein M3Z16_00640, partial [Pseudomonadota bacterium]|nr:hypothetical protein [Pseudomonadota bacterium]